MTQVPNKIQLDRSTYVTKVNGKLVVVRERRERLRDIGLDLLREAFGKYPRPKMSNHSKKQKGEKTQAETPMVAASQRLPKSALYNPNANLVGPATVPSIIGPMEPQPGIYRFGDRQLVLLPLNPQGGPVMPPQMGLPYPQPPMMFPLVSNTNGFNFPPMGISPQQFITNSAPPIEDAGPTSITVSQHVCVECGKLRSRKYQHANPLKPGEVPPVSFCGRCQKDITSTDESDTGEEKAKKHHKESKKSNKEKTKSKYSTDSAESIGFTGSVKISKAEGKSRNEASSKCITSDKQRSKHGHRIPRAETYGKEDCLPRRIQASSLSDESYLEDSRSISSLQEDQTDSPVFFLCKNHPARRLSIDSLATDAAVQSYHTRTTPSLATSRTNDTDRTSQKTCSSESSAFPEATPHRHYGHEDRIRKSSNARSDEAPRRRRLERNRDIRETDWETTKIASDMYPRGDYEDKAVTERYVRSRPLAHVREEELESRSTNPVDETAAHFERSYPSLSAEAEASEYYRKDWFGKDEHDILDYERFHLSNFESITSPSESHNLALDSVLPHRSKLDKRNFSEAWRPARSSDQRRQPNYQISPPFNRERNVLREDDSLPPLRNRKYTTARHEAIAAPGNSKSSYRPPYVREATDKGTERTSKPSPEQSREILSYPDASESEITEEIERAERHVTFYNED